MRRRDIAVPSWCTCGKCCKTPKDDESVCCGVRPCRTSYGEFTEFMKSLEESLKEPSLREKHENAFFGTLSEEARSKARLIYENLTDMGKLRRLCYWKTCSLFHDDDRYAALPSCVVWVIRRQYEEQDGRYTGFPPKLELLQNVVDARKTFKRDMDVYKTVVDAANLNGGLFSTVHKLNEDGLNAVYDEILLREGDVTNEERAAAMRKERWTECTSKGKDVLPRLGHVACAAAFEAFVHDAFKRCLETVFSTSKVSETDEKFWKSWLQSRAKESVGWQQQEHESEIRFWTEFEPTKDVLQYDSTQPEEPHQNHVLQKLRKYWPNVFKYLKNNATSQEVVGLVQEMVDTKKQNIMHNLNTQMDCIQENFRKIAECVESKEKRKRKARGSYGSPPKKQKTKRMSEVASHEGDLVSPSSSSSMSNISSEITDSSYSMSTRSSLGSAEVGLPMETSTPVAVSARKSQKIRLYPPVASTVTSSSIICLMDHYAKKYHWQIWVDRASYDVKCNSVKSLSYLSTLFYGIRNIFCHGTPEKIVSGALRLDRTPRKSSDLSILVTDRNQTDEERDQATTHCQSYLFDLFIKATTEFGEMDVNHDLFLTAQSFYEYSVEIVGRMAACIVYRYGDVKLREKATYVDTQEMQEIKRTVQRAWNLDDDEIGATALSAASQSSESQADDLPVHGSEMKMTSTGQSTGISQDFSEASLQ